MESLEFGDRPVFSLAFKHLQRTRLGQKLHCSRLDEALVLLLFGCESPFLYITVYEI